MDVNYNREDKSLVIKIEEEIDHHNVQMIKRRMDYEIERYMPKRVVFDFNSVTFMDSAGIGMIIGRYKQIQLIGGKLEIANLQKSVRKILEMSGILKIIPERLLNS